LRLATDATGSAISSFVSVPHIFALGMMKRPDFFFRNHEGRVRPGHHRRGGWRTPFPRLHVSTVSKPQEADVVEGVRSKAYVTPAKSVCPALHPNKANQRMELVEDLKGGTVLELFAGEGNLSKHVYADKADKIIAVDMDSKALRKAEDKLEGEGVKVETYAANNVDWIEDKLPELKGTSHLGNLKVVDFDAFGSPAESMKAFFSTYKVSHPMRVGVTDGSSVYVSQLGVADNEAKRREWIRRKYGVGYRGSWDRAKQMEILDSFMRRLGDEHGFKVREVNEDHGDQWAVYKGYTVSPD